MADPRRVVWLLAAGIGFATIPSLIAYWTHSLWLCKLMFCIFIPAIYFYIGPCFGLLNNLAPCHMRNMFIAISLLVANIFNLMVAPWVVGALSDWFAGSLGAAVPVDALALFTEAEPGAPFVLHAVHPLQRDPSPRSAASTTDREGAR